MRIRTLPSAAEAASIVLSLRHDCPSISLRMKSRALTKTKCERMFARARASRIRAFKRLVLRIMFSLADLGKIAVGDAAKFGADGVRGETGAEQAAVNAGDLALAERTAKVREATLETSPDQFGFGRVGEHGFECSVDVPVRHTAGAEFASDAKASLAASVGALAGKFKRVTGVIKIVVLAEPGHDLRNGVFVVRAALQVGAHLVNRMGAAHEGTERGGVKLLLGCQLPGSGSSAHERSIVARKQGSKEARKQGSKEAALAGPIRLPVSGSTRLNLAKDG
jgi:hypothetical protein